MNDERIYFAIPKASLEALKFEQVMTALSWDAARHENTHEGYYVFSNLTGPTWEWWKKAGLKPSEIVVIGHHGNYMDWLRGDLK